MAHATAPPASTVVPSPPIAKEPEPPPPKIDRTGWTTFGNDPWGIHFQYPNKTFHRAPSTSQIDFVSNLSRRTLGEGDTGNWTYGFHIRVRQGTPEANLTHEMEPYAKDAFVDGKFKEDNELVKRTTLLGKKGYFIQSGVEGYNSENYFLAIDEKRTLIVVLASIGSVMSPEVDESVQLATMHAVIDSITFH